MSSKRSVSSYDDQFRKLPSGFKFHPSDDELLRHYLIPWIEGREIPSRMIIMDLDVFNYDPDQLPLDRFEYGRDKEGYFILLCRRGNCWRVREDDDHSLRTTPNGYWKIFEQNVPIYDKDNDKLLGFKNKCFFYYGTYPNGDVTDWKMSEYRCNPDAVLHYASISNNDFIICKVKLKDMIEELEEEMFIEEGLSDDEHKF